MAGPSSQNVPRPRVQAPLTDAESAQASREFCSNPVADSSNGSRSALNAGPSRGEALEQTPEPQESSYFVETEGPFDPESFVLYGHEHTQTSQAAHRETITFYEKKRGKTWTPPPKVLNGKRPVTEEDILQSVEEYSRELIAEQLNYPSAPSDLSVTDAHIAELWKFIDDFPPSLNPKPTTEKTVSERTRQASAHGSTRPELRENPVEVPGSPSLVHTEQSGASVEQEVIGRNRITHLRRGVAAAAKLSRRNETVAEDHDGGDSETYGIHNVQDQYGTKDVTIDSTVNQPTAVDEAQFVKLKDAHGIIDIERTALTTSKSKLYEMEKTVRDLKARLRNSEQTVGKLRTTVLDRYKSMKELRAAREANKKQIGELQKAATADDSRISTLEEEVSRSNGEIGPLKTAASTTNDEIRDLETQADED
ncbi:hypothetical protein NX059_011775 [Plenodomus lindquistii]|nr:hypothetical protein NX059_011775 [Plenodomus lindquistii]